MNYIIFDMDDTLLNNNREISPYTLEVLKTIRSMGNFLVCNTARSQAFNQMYFDQLRPDYAILNGGALIINKDEEPVFLAEVDAVTTRAVIGALLKETEDLFVQTRGDYYSHKGKSTFQNAVPFDFSTEEFALPAQKIVASVADDARAEEIAAQFGLAYTTYGSGTFRRYSHPGATKALGNQNLMKLVGGSVADIIAFGDDHGDMDMLREAGVGVLMKNAAEKLHGQCPYTTRYTNDEDGVARFLSDYFHLDI